MKNSKTDNAKVNFHEAQKRERFRETVSLQLYKIQLYLYRR